jgi:hypothetical protein
MDDLRKAVIRLAHENPELRPHLLPLLKQGARRKSAPQAAREIKRLLEKGDQKKATEMYYAYVGDYDDAGHKNRSTRLWNLGVGYAGQDAVLVSSLPK